MQNSANEKRAAPIMILEITHDKWNIPKRYDTQMYTRTQTIS